MNSFFSSGDIVRIPQGVTLVRTTKDLQAIDAYQTLNMQRYGIYVGKVNEYYHEIILDNTSWYLDGQDIYEGETNVS